MDNIDEINWDAGATPKRQDAGSLMNLKEINLSEAADVKITDIRMTKQGYIVAEVESEVLVGDTLWLSGKFGLQNGAFSLKNLVGTTKASDMLGQYYVSKIPSDKSSTGYRYEWTK